MNCLARVLTAIVYRSVFTSLLALSLIYNLTLLRPSWQCKHGILMTCKKEKLSYTPSACGSVYVGNALLKNVCGQAITFLVLRYPFYPGSFLCFSSHSRLIQQLIKFQLSTPTPPIKIAWYTVWQPFWALWTMCGVPYTRQLNQTNSGSKYTIQAMLSNLLLKQQFTVIPASIKKLLKVWIIYSSLKSTWQLLQNIVSVTLELLSRNN